MQEIRELWQRLTTSRYTRTLEREVARLRAENRALLNSILGIAGIPPIPVAPFEAALMDMTNMMNTANEFARTGPLQAPQHSSQDTPRTSVPALPRSDKPESGAPARARFSANAGGNRRDGAAARSGSAREVRFNGQPPTNPSPMRRRSWQQINRMLEFESARKRQQD
jgi:hypothetical protein